ncbi:MAG TPA: ATP synthase F1 subunit gamma [Candidatus Saccharimonadales bacterium]|nr:ATP synthase F1 subunit gamma [Candidatus Saccharimonadales bacterium]
MANTITIKRRIGSIKSTRQITKAMQLVAASRMRKAQEAAQRSRPYGEMASALLTRLAQITEIEASQLFVRREVKARLLVVVTSDRGLAGAYNSNILRAYVGELKKDQAAKVKTYTICVGQKAAQFVARIKETEVVGVYKNLPTDLHVNDLAPIMRTAIDLFVEEKIDAVDVIYTHYYSTIRQEPKLHTLLPAGFTTTEVPADLKLASFEPSVEEVLESTTRRLLEAQLWQDVLESVASEQSMRMVAMKNATDNANELVEDYTLEYNNARQGKITQELAEITGGAEALKD